MKRNILLLTALVFAFAGSALAQRPTGAPARPTTAAPQPTPAPQTASVALPTSKMGIIYSDLFLDSKEGINKFAAALNKLNGEFLGPKNEITQMQTRAQTLQDEITKLQQAPAGTPIDQRSLQTKIDQLDQLKKDAQRKAEDGQAAYNKRRTELFGPLQQEVGVALEAYAKARGINVIIDAAQVPLIYAAESIDITKAFIVDFNAKNPVAAATAPRP
jgi:Skp family chaperone for outer membrane proteins